MREKYAMELTSIDGIAEIPILAYFTLLNQNEFRCAAALFSTEGCLQPPFDQLIQGREAIAKYFEKESKGMQFCPRFGEKLDGNTDYNQFVIQGVVETSLFTVSIKWLMRLNSVKEITTVEVRLLDSLSDLLIIKNSL
jgi:hypothetical protein